MRAAAVVTAAAGDTHGRLLSIARPSIERFADRHGYDVVVHTERASERPPAWDKVLHIQAALASYLLVLWLDCDLVVLEPAVSPLDRLDMDSFHGLVRQHDGVANTGVWALRASKEATAFLDAVWNSTEFLNNGTWEQAAVNHLLAVDDGGTCYFPRDYNAIHPEKGRINHYAGWPMSVRETLMRADAAAAAGRSLEATLRRSAFRVRTSLAMRVFKRQRRLS